MARSRSKSRSRSRKKKRSRSRQRSRKKKHSRSRSRSRKKKHSRSRSRTRKKKSKSRKSRKSRSRSRHRDRKSKKKKRSRSRSSGRRRHRSRSRSKARVRKDDDKKDSKKKDSKKKDNEKDIKKDTKEDCNTETKESEAVSLKKAKNPDDDENKKTEKVDLTKAEEQKVEEKKVDVKKRKRKRLWDEAPLGGVAPTPAVGMANSMALNTPNSIAAGINPLLLLAQHNPLLAAMSVAAPQRTVFVGNVLPHFSEAMIQEFLDKAIISVPERPKTLFPSAVCNVTVKRDKMYAFVEMYTTTDADVAVCMDGVAFHGTSLLIRRHSQYVVPKGEQKIYAIPGVVSTIVENDANKIFIGPLDASLSDEDVKGFVSTFGPLKAFVLVKDPKTGEPKGFSFFSYADGSVTDAACRGLNGIDLCGKKVVCRRAIINRVSESLGIIAPPTVESETSPSRILVLSNIVPPMIECKSDPHLMNLKEQVVNRCAKYGTILDVQITEDDVFVEYKDVTFAMKAMQSLSGAMIHGKVAISSYLPDNEYKEKKILAAAATVARAEQPDPPEPIKNPNEVAKITYVEPKSEKVPEEETSKDIFDDKSIETNPNSLTYISNGPNIEKKPIHSSNGGVLSASIALQQIQQNEFLTKGRPQSNPNLFNMHSTLKPNLNNSIPYQSMRGAFRPAPGFENQCNLRGNMQTNGRPQFGGTNMNINMMNIRSSVTGNLSEPKIGTQMPGGTRPEFNPNINTNMNMASLGQFSGMIGTRLGAPNDMKGGSQNMGAGSNNNMGGRFSNMGGTFNNLGGGFNNMGGGLNMGRPPNMAVNMRGSPQMTGGLNMRGGLNIGGRPNMALRPNMGGCLNMGGRPNMGQLPNVGGGPNMGRNPNMVADRMWNQHP